jgi:hypothetical protein
MTVKKAIRIREIPEYTYLGCPLTKNRSPWCFRLCRPNKDGTGLCGRVAPHLLMGHIQKGIIDYKKQQIEKEIFNK